MSLISATSQFSFFSQALTNLHIAYQILSHTSIQDIVHFSSTQKLFAPYLNHPDLWREIYKKIGFLEALQHVDLTGFARENIKIIKIKEKLDQMTTNQFAEHLKFQTDFPFLKKVAEKGYISLWAYILKRDEGHKKLSATLIIKSGQAAIGIPK